MRRLVLLLAIASLPACSDGSGGPSAPSTPAAGELTIIDLEPGAGDVISAGSTAVVHYTGWLYDPEAEHGKGEKFDSSLDRGQPFRFPLGGGRVIRGWDEGVVGMKVGGKRRLIIPPEYGYGARGAGDVIPPNATLVFDIELRGIE